MVSISYRLKAIYTIVKIVAILWFKAYMGRCWKLYEVIKMNELKGWPFKPMDGPDGEGPGPGGGMPG